MKRIKQTKGITLVALILTIVILLILAVVTISTVQGDGIIDKALQAKTDYEDAQLDAKDEYETEMGKIFGTSQGDTSE